MNLVLLLKTVGLSIQTLICKLVRGGMHERVVLREEIRRLLMSGHVHGGLFPEKKGFGNV
jgi:hypothetical protein